MSNNIAVITQEESDTKLLPNPNLTMAVPYLVTLLVTQIPKNKLLLQMTMWGERVAPPAPETKHIKSSHTYAKSRPSLP
jgi:hypothetical protein